MFYQVTALILLGVFYAVYFGKMIIQKRKGIQTDQIAKGKQHDRVFYVELLLKIATIAAPLAQVTCILQNLTLLPDAVRIAGATIALAGDIIFLLSVYTMKDSWRAGIPSEDKTQLITNGIYQISRNPAFLGFDLSYLGITLMFCHPVSIALSLLAAVMLHLQILQEEAFLPTVFGKAYQDYCQTVRRYLGRY